MKVNNKRAQSGGVPDCLVSRPSYIPHRGPGSTRGDHVSDSQWGGKIKRKIRRKIRRPYLVADDVSEAAEGGVAPEEVQHHPRGAEEQPARLKVRATEGHALAADRNPNPRKRTDPPHTRSRECPPPD